MLRSFLCRPLLVLAAFVGAAQGATYTWDGNGADSNWSTGGNWLRNLPPPSNVNTVLIFTGNSNLTAQQNISNDFLLNTLIFDNAAGPFNLTGLALDFRTDSSGASPAITQNSASAERITNNLVLSNALNLNGGGAGALTLSGVISGAGRGLAQTGSGTTVLTGTNTFTGFSTLDAGTLNINADAALGAVPAAATNNLTFGFGSASTGTLQLAAGAGSVTLNANRNIVLQSGIGAFDSNGASNTLTVAGVISGGGSLAKVGAGTLTLTGANTYTGPTTVSAGTLQVGGGGVSGSLGTNTGAITDNGTLAYNRSDNVSVANVISGTGGLVQAGAGTLTLTGVSTYTGDTNVNGGTLAVGNGGSIAGGMVNVNNSSTFTLSDGGKVSASSVNVGTSDGTTANFTQTGGISSVSSVLSVGAGSRSTGVYNLSGNGALSAYVERIGSGFVTGIFNQTGGTNTVANDGFFYVGTSGGNGAYNLSAGTLSAPNESVGTSGNGAFLQTGGVNAVDGELHVGYGGTYTLAGGVLSAGTVEGDPGSGRKTFNFNGGTLRARGDNGAFFSLFAAANVQAGGAVFDTNGFNVTVAQNLVHDPASGAPAADGGLTKQGAGTLTLTGANTFTGPLNINAGVLAVPGESSLGAGTSTLTVGGGGTLLFTADATLTRTYNLGISKLGAAAGTTLTFTGATINGGFLAGPGTEALGDGASLNAVTALAASNLTQTSGTATLNTSTFRGTLTQSAGATLNLADSTVTSAGKLNVSGTVNASGVEIDGVTAINSGGALASSGSNLVLGGGARMTVNAGGTLTAADGTSIELNGALLTNNGAQTGALDVNYGATLKGAGTFGAVNVTGGGTFAPGNSPGKATVTSLSFQATGHYQFELTSAEAANNSPGDHADLISASRILTISAGTTANSRFTVDIVSLDGNNSPAALSDFDPSKSYRFVLATTGGISGFAAGEFAVNTAGFGNALNGGRFSVVEDGNNLDLMFTPAPEPATWALLMLGGASLLVVTRRRASAQRNEQPR